MTIYARQPVPPKRNGSPGVNKNTWHIVTPSGYTLCYREAHAMEQGAPGEVCRSCAAIHEAQETGEGIPF